MARPEGVKIVRTDGTEIDCELIQLGPDERGLDVWQITGVKLNDGDKIKCAVLPARTSITVDTSWGRLNRGWEQ